MKHISVSKTTYQVDEPWDLKLVHLHPQQEVSVTATMIDANQIEWKSFATFRADQQGIVDCALIKPLNGSYSCADVMGLIWSMSSSKGDGGEAKCFADCNHIDVTLTLEVDQKVTESVTISRQFYDESIIRKEIREQGLVGVFYQPRKIKNVPAILLLGGSSGSIPENKAALLAMHGYPVFALAYFNAEGLPKVIQDIPLEYCETSLHWLQSQSVVSPNKIIVMGSSRGAELALLLGSIYPEIKGVIAYLPSHCVQHSFTGENLGNVWLLKGKPFPCAPVNLDAVKWDREPISLAPAFYLGKDTPALIKVENIQGPVLLISGGDDQMWPSQKMSERIMERLEEHQFQYSYEHLTYPKAGHDIQFTYWPATVKLTRHLFSDKAFAFGGTDEADAHAAEDAWQKVLMFLEQQ